MDEKIEKIVGEIKRYLKEKYGEKIKEVILYGSYARGDTREDSDVDVLVVVSDDLNPNDVEEYLVPLIGNFLAYWGELVPALAIKESEFLKEQSDFLINVRKEGIAV